MPKNQIDLSIIVINLSTDKYKTKIYLEKLLKSIVRALKHVSYEFILVDNSTIDDGTKQVATQKIDNLVYLKRDSVHTFCENNNYGIKNANGKYILFLNNDTEIIDNYIFVEMIDFLNKNPNVGAVTSTLVNSDKKTIQASGGYFPTLSRVFMWMTFLDNLPFVGNFINSYHPNKKYYEYSHDQDWITGAFYFTRKEILDRVGGFDEEYGAYVEEVDLSYRIKKLGFIIKYLSSWKTVHLGGMSYGGETQIIEEFKNLKLFYVKHYPTWQKPILNLTIKIGCLLRIIVFSVFKPNLVKVYAKALKVI